ncbi:MAG: hypothetical protein UHK60_04215 [Acutalibacteraceae bacterium]|nr:hypothetical protein [Acutalibacteraceae bacterium]
MVNYGQISNDNLRLQIDEIKIYEYDKKFRIEINLKVNSYD